MNILKIIKLASKLDKQGQYKSSDSVLKFVLAQTDDFDLSHDPLGMSVPNERKEKFADLRGRFERGEISEREFYDLFMEMVQTTPHSNQGDIDNLQTRLQSAGIQTFGEDRAFLEKVAEYADDLSIGWISEIEDDSIDFFRQNGIEVKDAYEAGDKLLDLAQGNPINNITINDAIRSITLFDDFYDYFDQYIREKIPNMVDMLKEVAFMPPYNKNIQVTEQEISTLFDEENINHRNINTTLEFILVKILLSKVR